MERCRDYLTGWQLEQARHLIRVSRIEQAKEQNPLMLYVYLSNRCSHLVAIRYDDEFLVG
jgi:hypothetical protein